MAEQDTSRSTWRGSSQTPRPAAGEESLVSEWLRLTSELLGDYDVTADELQELLAMQDKVRELIQKTRPAAAPETVIEEASGVVYRKVQ